MFICISLSCFFSVPLAFFSWFSFLLSAFDFLSIFSLTLQLRHFRSHASGQLSFLQADPQVNSFKSLWSSPQERLGLNGSSDKMYTVSSSSLRSWNLLIINIKANQTETPQDSSFLLTSVPLSNWCHTHKERKSDITNPHQVSLDIPKTMVDYSNCIFWEAKIVLLCFILFPDVALVLCCATPGLTQTHCSLLQRRLCSTKNILRVYFRQTAARLVNPLVFWRISCVP